MSDTNLAAIAADYQTLTTLYTKSIGGPERMLTANPRRWFVRFFLGSLSTPDFRVVPGPVDADVSQAIDNGWPQEYKFRDCPSIVTGEFYGVGANGSTIHIVECIYTRG